MQDESDHTHYLIVSAVTNLLVNLLGVWFFRSYDRVNIVYMKAEDMNYHSICLHVLADSVRRVENAEVLCVGIVSVAVFMLLRLLVISFCKLHQAMCHLQPLPMRARMFLKYVKVDFGTLYLVMLLVLSSLDIQVKNGDDCQSVLDYVHGLYQDLGIYRT
uniref:Uncharacterized protein n=1 Tax=Oryza punctata TaxID=4537 RepID=A0A0E0MII7_ORYPU